MVFGRVVGLTEEGGDGGLYELEMGGNAQLMLCCAVGTIALKLTWKNSTCSSVRFCAIFG